MIVIGIDAAKDKHDCQIVDGKGKIIVPHFTFQNNLSGFLEFDNLAKTCFNEENEDIKVGIEHTGHYSLNLASFLSKRGYTVLHLNPNIVNQYKKMQTLRNTKTDKLDCSVIAKVTLEQNELDYIYSTKMSELKSLCRASYRQAKILSEVRNHFRRCLQIAFPELETLFNPSVESTIRIANKYPSPRLVLKDTRENIESFFKEFKWGKYKSAIDDFIELAKNSIGNPNKGDIYELRMVSTHLLSMLTQQKTLHNRIEKIMLSLNSKIVTIPGIGIQSGAIILSEIGDINRFSTPEKLLAYAGCDPRIYESGKHVGYSAPINKRGSLYLRTTLFTCVKTAYIASPVMKEYIDSKRENGKHYYNAIFHGVKKLVRIIYRVLKENVDYKQPNTSKESVD